MPRKVKEENTKQTTKRTKKEVDPDRPKKPLSPYFRYVADKRAEVKAANPDLKMTEITKKIGDMWAQESEEVKQRYQEPYDEEKKEYDKKMEEYKKTHPTGKKSTDPDMPKRPLSAYFLYANEHRDEVKKSNPDMKITQIAATLGEMWKALSEEDKKPYVEKHEQMKEEYDVAIKEYYESHPDALKEKEGKKKRSKATKKEKKPKEEVEEKTETEEEEESENIFDNESE